jgi:hypothetical protein
MMSDQKTTLCKSTNRLKKDLARSESSLGLDGQFSGQFKIEWFMAPTRTLNLGSELSVRNGDSINDHLLCELSDW